VVRKQGSAGGYFRRPHSSVGPTVPFFQQPNRPAVISFAPEPRPAPPITLRSQSVCRPLSCSFPLSLGHSFGARTPAPLRAAILCFGFAALRVSGTPRQSFAAKASGLKPSGKTFSGTQPEKADLALGAGPLAFRVPRENGAETENRHVPEQSYPHRLSWQGR